ncbi:MAG: hypothetical protein U0894_13865 [Pirellulales bacterium]
MERHLSVGDDFDYVTNRLGLTTTGMFAMYGSSPISNPGDVTTYRLYPGGPSYSLGNVHVVWLYHFKRNHVL